MCEQKRIEGTYKTNSWLIGKLADGLTHEDSLALPTFKANSFNWVLGHILVGRDRTLKLLNQPAVLSESETNLYETGSNPVTLETAVSFDNLLKAVEESQKSISKGFEAADLDLLSRIYDEERDQTIGERISGLNWHETYHIGQLELLRQVSCEREAFP